MLRNVVMSAEVCSYIVQSVLKYLIAIETAFLKLLEQLFEIEIFEIFRIAKIDCFFFQTEYGQKLQKYYIRCT